MEGGGGGEEEKSGGEGRAREAGREILPGLFGLEIDRLSLSPNLSISPLFSPFSRFLSPFPHSLPPSHSGAERCRENEGQTEI